MRQMLWRISPVVCALVAVGGFVVTSTLPATAEAPGDRLDRLHAGRPVAAFPFNLMTGFDWTDPSALRDAAAFVEAAAAAQAEAEAAAEAAAPAWSSSATPTVAQAPRLGACNGDVECFLECTRAHESDTSGGYAAVGGGGLYRGAYQFQQSTWDAAVAGAGHDEWSGVPADQAPPEIQDAAAAHLYSVVGNRPWGGRC